MCGVPPGRKFGGVLVYDNIRLLNIGIFLQKSHSKFKHLIRSGTFGTRRSVDFPSNTKVFSVHGRVSYISEEDP